MRKVLIGLLVLVVLVVGGVVIWARSVLGGDAVRTQLASQLSSAIGQPVTIGSISATVYPRITVNLGEVGIGQPQKITARTLHVGTDFRALLSRRIEHARLRLDGARIELPLPEFTFQSSSEETTGDSAPAVELVSIDEIVLSNIEVVSSGRTLRGDIEVVPDGQAVTIRSMKLSADDTSVDVTGRIADIAGPAGELHIKAGQINVDRLLAFFQEFSTGAGLGAGGAAPSPSAPQAGAPGLNLTVALDADAASMGEIRLDGLSARLRLADQQIALEPLKFGLFSGRYDGTLGLNMAGTAPAFRWNAALSGINVGAITRFAGHPDTISGTLSGRIDLTGEGADAAAAIQTARGTARVEIVNGVIRNLGLVRSIIVATSMRGVQTAASGTGTGSASASSDERFKRLSATLNIAGAAARSNDLLFESDNLRLTAAGMVRLDGSAIDLKGQAQLSEALTKQAGRDLVRYTSQDGRVTFPVTITGSAENPRVRVDVGNLMQRAIRNRATEEVDKALKKELGKRGLGDLFKRR